MVMASAALASIRADIDLVIADPVQLAPIADDVAVAGPYLGIDPLTAE